MGGVWPGFGSRLPTEVASVGSCQKFGLYQARPMPASSRMDPALGRTETIRNNSNTFVITDLRRKENLLHQCNCGQRIWLEYVRGTAQQTARSAKEE